MNTLKLTIPIFLSDSVRNLIRIIRGIYGTPYDDEALFFNVLRYAYTDYTDFSGHTPFFRRGFIKNNQITRALARMR